MKRRPYRNGEGTTTQRKGRSGKRMGRRLKAGRTGRRGRRQGWVARWGWKGERRGEQGEARKAGRGPEGGENEREELGRKDMIGWKGRAGGDEEGSRRVEVRAGREQKWFESGLKSERCFTYVSMLFK